MSEMELNKILAVPLEIFGLHSRGGYWGQVTYIQYLAQFL